MGGTRILDLVEEGHGGALVGDGGGDCDELAALDLALAADAAHERRVGGGGRRRGGGGGGHGARGGGGGRATAGAAAVDCGCGVETGEQEGNRAEAWG